MSNEMYEIVMQLKGISCALAREAMSEDNSSYEQLEYKRRTLSMKEGTQLCLNF